MASVIQIPGEAFVRLVRDALENQVRLGLKEPLMKQAEAMVDNAVDQAVAALKPRIETWINEQYRSLDINILVKRVASENDAEG